MTADAATLLCLIVEAGAILWIIRKPKGGACNPPA